MEHDFFIICDFLFLKQNIPICANNNRFIYGSLAIISEIVFQLLSNATFGLCVWWTLSEVIKNVNLLETCKISKFSWAQARQLWKVIRLTFGRLRSRYESTNWSAKHFANTLNVNVMCAKTNISLKKRFMFREFKEFIPHLNLLFVVRHLNSDVDCGNRK